MILKSVNITTLSLGGYWHIQTIKISYPYVLYVLLRGSGQTILSSTEVRVPALKAFNASGEKHASRKAVRRRLWFMALSTSDLVADSLSVSSVGEGSGSHLALASPCRPGAGAWPVLVGLAIPALAVRRALFLLQRS